MASGKQSPRQKMINLMYLVFIAMLAMQMDKEVLSAFGFTNEKLTENNISVIEKNKEAYTNLDTKAQEQAAKFGPLKIQADKIKGYSAEFYDYLGNLKTEMLKDIEKKDEYESMDKMDWLDAHFFKGDGYTPEGQEFLDKINDYRTNVIEVLGQDSKFTPTVIERFSTDDVINKKTKKSVPFLKARYEGFPMVASLTNFTQMQADIKNTEADIVAGLLGGQLESEVSMKNYNGVVSLSKNAFYPGEKVKGTVVLGRYDATLKPTKVEYGSNKDYKNFKDGQVIIDQSAGSVGDHKIKGVIYFTENGEDIPVPFESSYSVIPLPNSAVVSADKMNVVYRGVSNPITISVPGVSSNKISASATGLRKVSGDKYTMSPGSGNEVTINVSATLPNGKKINTPKKFRIKDIPAAMGMVRGQTGIVRMPKSSAARIQVAAGLPDFLFDLKLQVLSFSIKVPGQLTVKCNGGLNAKAKQMINKARRGDVITIFDIKAKVTNSSYQLKKVLPVSIEITN